MPGFLRQGIVRLLVWILLSGIAVGFYAYWTRDTTQLTSELVSDMPNVSPDRIWATGERTFAGYSARSGQVTVWHVTAAEDKAISGLRNIDAPDALPGTFAVSPDGAHAFWLASSQLVAYDLAQQTARRVDVAELEANSIVHVGDSHGAIISPSGAIRIFRTSSLEPVVGGAIPIRNADLIEANGPFIAIAERSSGAAVVVDTRISSKVGLTETRNLGMRIAAMTLTAGGTLAIATERGSIIAGTQLGAPGAVGAIRYFDEDRSFLVAGAFRGVHLIPTKGPTQEISVTDPGVRALAVSPKYFLLAYPDRVQLHAVRPVAVVGARAVNIFRVWFGLSLSVVSKSLFGMLLKLLRLLRRMLIEGSDCPRAIQAKDDTQKRIPEVGEPPMDLLASANERSCVIFAGEDLSRASAMPTWRTFVLGLIDRLYDSLLLEPARAEAARNAHRAGQVEQVIKNLEPLVLSHRELLNEYAQGMYCKPAALTRIHEALSGVGACAFVTPNLDSLLERCFGVASQTMFAPAEASDALACLLRRQFVGMKLRGLFHRPETLRVWPSEAQAENARHVDLGRFLGEILNSRSIIFVGVNPEEIERWLAPAGLSGRPARRHYALIPKTETYTAKQAHALAKRLNIHCLVYSADDPEPVIAFLTKLRPRADAESGPSAPAAAATSP